MQNSSAFVVSALLIVIPNLCVGQTVAVVNFNNNLVFSTPADRLVYFGSISPGNELVGTKFKAQLYVGTSPDLLEPVGTSASFRVPTTIAPGTWSGGFRNLITATTTYYDGQQVLLAVRAWDSGTGASYETATARGSSSVFSYVYSDSPAPVCCYMEGLRAFAVVPEPDMLAFAGVALFGLLKKRGSRP